MKSYVIILPLLKIVFFMSPSGFSVLGIFFFRVITQGKGKIKRLELVPLALDSVVNQITNRKTAKHRDASSRT